MRVLGIIFCVLVSASYGSTAMAGTPTIHSDFALFDAELNVSVTDDYTNPSYEFSQSDAVMSAVLGETDYTATRHANSNLIPSEYYCAGCNGSFRLSFTTTSVTDGGVGVFGVGITVRGNSGDYIAFVTYGDGTTSNEPVSASGTYWAITAPELITSIHFGLVDGGARGSGAFHINDLTIGNKVHPDFDSDGVATKVDNCPFAANSDQADVDSDGIGDVCDAVNDLDLDSDGINNDVDNCPFIANGASGDNQADDDNDGIGDACDNADALDVDADGVDNAMDNCPFVANGTNEDDQADTDADGVGNACDSSNGLDLDSDGVNNDVDNCPNVANGAAEDNQADTDADGLGDACDATDGLDIDGDGVANLDDNCPVVANDAQADSDGDDVGDACDSVDNNDVDGDGVANAIDNCAAVPNSDQADADEDGLGDSCDLTNDVDSGGCTTTNSSGSPWALVLIGLVLGFRRRRTRLTN